MLKLKVHLLVDRLPFNTEGYTWAKNILTSRYGNVSEVVNAIVQAIMTLPIVHGSHSIHIHNFYEKLLAHVHPLEIMEKLRTVKEYVRKTLDKLQKILSYLVSLDGE